MHYELSLDHDPTLKVAEPTLIVIGKKIFFQATIIELL